MYWHPISCTLQLTFPSSTGGVIGSGASYNGTSAIRYRKQPVPLDATAASEDISTEYGLFSRHLQTLAESGALHLHALTRPLPSSANAPVFPLHIQSYRVTTKNGTGQLKVISVTEEDGAAVEGKEDARGGSSGPALANERGRKSAGVKAKPSSSGGGKKAAQKQNGANEATSSAPTAASPTASDAGSKLVRFDGSEGLPCGAEVELVVQFSGSVQRWENGAIYAPASAATSDTGSLLTHFEVSLARAAFPCPDHPQYRLEWQLKSLQLPAVYTTVITNGSALSTRKQPQQKAVQFSFAPCGPLPAYVFAFAAFAGTDPVLNVVESTLHIPCASSLLSKAAASSGGAAAVADADADGGVEIPLRVLATPASGITEEVMQRVCHTVKEAVPLLEDFFGCPLPLLQSTHLDVLLAPTMAYISGMEHHGCVFLNETIYSGSRKKDSGNPTHTAAQTELIIHELAHHWVGNALGVPFAVKEGICQVLEQYFGDVVLGKPPRKFKSLGGEDEAEAIAETTKGKEFTGHSYQHALLSLQRMVAEAGFATFQKRMQCVIRRCVTVPMARAEEHGGRGVGQLCSENGECFAPYLSTESFMAYMASDPEE